VTFTATVTGGGGTPTGLTFTIDGTSGTPINLVNGAASTSTSTLTVAGSPHSVSATYSGDGTFSGSSGSLPGGQIVNKGAGNGTTTNVASSLNPTVFGQTATFTATVSGSGGTPTGTVTFTIDGTIGSPINLVNGAASTSTSTLTVAGSPHTVSAAYSGDGTFAGSTGSLPGGQTVNKANTTTTLTSSQNPSALNQGLGFTATVSAVAPGAGTPTGTVTFTIDGIGQPTNTLTNGTVTFSTSSLGVGNHTLVVTYAGDNNFNGSGPASLTQNVKQGTTATTLTAAPNPSTSGQLVTFTATVSVTSGTGTPTGTVTFKDGGTTIGTSPLGLGRTATFSTPALTVGNHTITAVYSGDTNFTASVSAALTQTVSASTSDSVKLRELQVSAAPTIANAWAQSVTAAMDDAVTTGSSGNPRSLSPAGTGFTYYFDGDPATAAQRRVRSRRARALSRLARRQHKARR
jgi:large repetitive protein